MLPAERLGIDCLSVFELPPVQFVELAAGLGCGFITLGVPVTLNPENYAGYRFTDSRVQRDVKAALRDHGVAVKAGEGFFFMPHIEAQDFAPHLDAMAEIGAQTINMVSLEVDLGRSLDRFAALAEMSAARGMPTSLEFVAGQVIGNLEEGARAVRHVGRPDCKLVVDMLHLARSGGGAAGRIAAGCPGGNRSSTAKSGGRWCRSPETNGTVREIGAGAAGEGRRGWDRILAD